MRVCVGERVLCLCRFVSLQNKKQANAKTSSWSVLKLWQQWPLIIRPTKLILILQTASSLVQLKPRKVPAASILSWGQQCSCWLLVFISCSPMWKQPVSCRRLLTPIFQLRDWASRFVQQINGFSNWMHCGGVAKLDSATPPSFFSSRHRRLGGLSVQRANWQCHLIDWFGRRSLELLHDPKQMLVSLTLSLRQSRVLAGSHYVTLGVGHNI